MPHTIRTLLTGTALTAFAAVPLSAFAQVSADEVARLGQELTPVGAERAGNDAGTIPEWVGRKAWRDNEINITHAQLETFRKETAAQIEALITQPDAIKDFMKVTQMVADRQSGARETIVKIFEAAMAEDASLKAAINNVLADRGRDLDSALSELRRGNAKFTDFADDVIAVLQHLAENDRRNFQRAARAFDVGGILGLLAEITDAEASAAANDLLIRYMPDNVRDFLTPAHLSSQEQAEFLRPRYVITRENLDQHRDKLTPGQLAMFETYPTYKMIVYPTVRNAFFPDEIYEATKENARQASLEGTDEVKNAQLGFPFPIPQSGAEVIWNHKLKFRGSSIRRFNNQAIVRSDGRFSISKLVEDVKFVYANLDERAERGERDILFYLQETIEPPRVAGQFTLVHEQIGPGATARNAWLFSPGLGRVNRAPDVGYDNPAIGSDGEQFYDQVDVFNGALDRYNWKLVGKREVLIPYNSWILNSPSFRYADLVRAGHINQDLARYEKHRVWVVEAELRQGERHQLARRTFYVDEDSWSIALVEGYDNRGQLWKFQEAHLLTVPFIPTVSGIPEIIYDLQSNRYFVTAMTNEDPISDFEVSFDIREFSPAALQRRARRR